MMSLASRTCAAQNLMFDKQAVAPVAMRYGLQLPERL